MISMSLRHRPITRFGLTLGVAALLAASASCSKDPVIPTPILTTETFSGSLDPLGTSSHQFTVNYDIAYTDASITLTSLTSKANGTPAGVTIGVAFGTMNVGVCTRSPNYTNPAAPLNTALPTTGAPFISGVYCVQVFDNPTLPTLTEAVNYTIQVKHY
jgi:hypothetical protein